MASDKPEVELFIKASPIDGERKGSCIFCQKWFMLLYLKSKANELALTVTTVNMKQYPREIKELTHSPPPILMHGDIAMPEEKIEAYLKATFADAQLFYDDPIMRRLISNIFLKFNHYLTAANQDALLKAEKTLLHELRGINQYLAEEGGRFLCGDNITLYDCELMPKLQHIRVAAKHYRNFEIPHNLKHLWMYLGTAYDLDAFRESCPADQDIIAHYRSKACQSATANGVTSAQLAAKASRLQRDRAALEALERPTYSFELPDNLVNGHFDTNGPAQNGVQSSSSEASSSPVPTQLEAPNGTGNGHAVGLAH